MSVERVSSIVVEEVKKVLVRICQNEDSPKIVSLVKINAFFSTTAIEIMPSLLLSFMETKWKICTQFKLKSCFFLVFVRRLAFLK